jgi:hypothetical protein
MKAAIASIGLLLGLANANAGWFNKKPADVNIESLMASSAEAVNKQTPIISADGPRLNRVSTGPGLVITYHYTLPNVQYSPAAVKYIQGEFANELRPKVCGNVKIHVFLKRSVSLIYAYSAMDGTPIWTVLVTPQQCGF